MTAINWKVTRSEHAIITDIVERAAGAFAASDIAFNRLEVTMDITAVHANGCPLDLDGLLNAEPFDFVHDIAGIAAHLDRSTGRLGDCFVPRFALRDGGES